MMTNSRSYYSEQVMLPALCHDDPLHYCLVVARK